MNNPILSELKSHYLALNKLELAKLIRKLHSQPDSLTAEAHDTLSQVISERGLSKDALLSMLIVDEKRYYEERRQITISKENKKNRRMRTYERFMGWVGVIMCVMIVIMSPASQWDIKGVAGVLAFFISAVWMIFKKDD